MSLSCVQAQPLKLSMLSFLLFIKPLLLGIGVLVPTLFTSLPATRDMLSMCLYAMRCRHAAYD